MGGKYYQDEAKAIVDYALFQLPGSEEFFRGPPFELIEGEYVSFIGAAQTFGTFARYPFSHILAERLPRQVLNLGIGGAGPARFVRDNALLEIINQGRIAVIQVMSGRSAENSEYECLSGTSAIRRRGTFGPYRLAEVVWRELIAQRSERDVRRLIAETQDDWLSGMVGLCARITIPKVLVWISHRSPNSYPVSLEDEIKPTMQTFPHFITETMLHTVIKNVDRYVEATGSRGSPQLLSDMRTGMPVMVKRGESGFRWQSGYPSPEMHEDIANALFPILKSLCGS